MRRNYFYMMGKALCFFLAIPFMLVKEASSSSFNFSDLTDAQLNSVVEEMTIGLAQPVALPPVRKSRVDVDVESNEYDIGGIELEFESESRTEYSGMSIEVGTTYSLISVDQIKSISTTQTSQIPHASIFVASSLFWGLSLAVSYSPAVTVSDFKTERLSFLVSSDIVQSLLKLPFGFDLRLHMTDAKFSFVQTDPATEVFYDAFVYGAGVVMGYRWGSFEPYIGANWSKTKGQLGAAVPVFSSTLTSLPSLERTVELFEYFAGLQLKVFFINLAVEGGLVGPVSRVSGKFSYSF